jgi:hypothetical protein
MHSIRLLHFVDTPGLPKFPIKQHALLLYSSDNEDKAPAKYVNAALSRGQLAIYVPIPMDNAAENDTLRASQLGSGISNFEDNVNGGNLLTLDIRSFYDSLIAGNMQPFEELKILLEEAIRERIASGKSPEVTFVSGIAGTLAANQKFDQCINSERWWQKTHGEWLQNGLKVTMICSHPSRIFDRSQFMHYTQTMSSLHEEIVEDMTS